MIVWSPVQPGDVGNLLTVDSNLPPVYAAFELCQTKLSYQKQYFAELISNDFRRIYRSATVRKQ